MVESAFEFARVCRKHDYHNFLFSMKASNPLVMVQAYRLLARPHCTTPPRTLSQAACFGHQRSGRSKFDIPATDPHGPPRPPKEWPGSDTALPS